MRDPWGIELAYGTSPVSGDPIFVSVDDAEPSPAPLPVREAPPFNARASLYYGAVTYSLHRTDRADVYLAGLVGGITFDAGEHSIAGDPRAFTDLLLGVGFGGSIRLDRLILLRGDVRAYSQPCRGRDGREGFTCDNGSLLGHAEISGGIVLTFPGLPDGSASLTRSASTSESL